MWESFTQLEIPAMQMVVRGTLVYFALLFLFRISGKREIGQMGATEFITVLLISDSVQNSMTGGDNSLVGGLLIAAVLIFWSVAIAWVKYRHQTFSKIVEGTPTLLVHDGRPLEKALAKEWISNDDLEEIMRKQGVQSIKELKSAILEVDGTVSLLRYDDLAAKLGQPSE